jgi:hypothetical protein
MIVKIIVGAALVIALVITCLILTDIQANTPSAIPDIDHESMTWMPHYVKIEVMPECRDCGIALWASDDLPVTSGYTDNQSEIVFPLISSVKYHVVCPKRNISILLYPRESEYVIWGMV